MTLVRELVVLEDKVGIINSWNIQGSWLFNFILFCEFTWDYNLGCLPSTKFIKHPQGTIVRWVSFTTPLHIILSKVHTRFV
jgi:hypothetical protein